VNNNFFCNFNTPLVQKPVKSPKTNVWWGWHLNSATYLRSNFTMSPYLDNQRWKNVDVDIGFKICGIAIVYYICLKRIFLCKLNSFCNNTLQPLYEVCLKSNGTCTLHEKLLSQRKKHCFLWCHNVLWFWKPNFSILWQLHFLHVFLSKHFLCDRFVKIW